MKKYKGAKHVGGECVYVIAAKSVGACKIGRSTKRNAQDRVDTLRPYCPVPIELAFVFTTDDSRRLEHHVHGLLYAKRLHDEWFSVTPEEAVAAIHRAHENRIASPHQPFDDKYPKSMNKKYFPRVPLGKDGADSR